MCIRDSCNDFNPVASSDVNYNSKTVYLTTFLKYGLSLPNYPQNYTCLLYTSDAADERSSVDLGGRRLIEKKKKNTIYETYTLRNKHKTQFCSQAQYNSNN